MKKLLIAVFTALMMSISASPAKASGIPVVDVAGILQMVMEGLAEAERFRQQIVEAQNRLNQLKDTAEHYKDMVEGHYNFEDIINDPYVNEFMNSSEWRDIYNQVGDIDDLRAEFGLYSDNPSTQEIYDRKVRKVKAQQRYHDLSVARNNQLKELLDQFTSADTPSKKEDLANAIKVQQLQIENDKNTMAALSKLMEEQAEIEATIQAQNEFDEFNQIPDSLR